MKETQIHEREKENETRRKTEKVRKGGNGKERGKRKVGKRKQEREEGKSKVGLHDTLNER